MRLAALAIATTAAAIVIASCNRTPTTPSLITQSGQTPPGTSELFLEIVGPRTVAPGATAQFQAIAHRSDNTTQDVTGTAIWRSSRTSVLTLDKGVATGLTVGESIIDATSVTRSSRREIIVTPDGTFRLVGRVAEADSPGTSIAGARIEIADAPGPSTTTDLFGQYRLYGVPANAQIRVSKNGYVPRVENLTLVDHRSQNFTLAWASPRPEVSGTYTMTIALADRCRSSYPEATFSRTYTAVVVQNGPALTVTLSDATFVVDRGGNGNRFRGRMEPGQIVFSIGNADDFYYYYYGRIPGVVEEIEPTLYYMVFGSVTIANATPNRLSGMLNGAIMTKSRDPRQGGLSPEQECVAPDHQFVLSR
jgi:hypothetical protein